MEHCDYKEFRASFGDMSSTIYACDYVDAVKKAAMLFQVDPPMVKCTEIKDYK